MICRTATFPIGVTSTELLASARLGRSLTRAIRPSNRRSPLAGLSLAPDVHSPIALTGKGCCPI